MANPRKGTYGFLIRINAGISLTQFDDLAFRFSASGSGDSFTLYASTSQVFVGLSTIRSSALGVSFQSGEWAWARTGSAEPFACAQTYITDLEAKSSGKYFLSPSFQIDVDE